MCYYLSSQVNKEKVSLDHTQPLLKQHWKGIVRVTVSRLEKDKISTEMQHILLDWLT